MFSCETVSQIAAAQILYTHSFERNQELEDTVTNENYLINQYHH